MSAGSESRWGWSAEEFRRVGYRVVDRIADYLAHLPSEPAFRPVPESLAAGFLREPPPEAGQGIEDRPELEAMALADSLALDPHRWLYVPEGAIHGPDAASRNPSRHGISP